MYDSEDPDDVWTMFDRIKLDDDVNDKKQSTDAAIKELQCSHCNSTDLHIDEGNYVCQKCSAIVCRYLDSSAEWRCFQSEDSKNTDITRCGGPTNDLLPNSSLGSVIGFNDKGKEDYGVYKMRRYHLWNSMNYPERTLYNIFEIINTTAMANGITKNIVDDAKSLYKQFSEMKVGRGDNRHSLIASSLYMSFKKNKVPRSAKEIAHIFNLEVTTMTKGCKKFQEIMNMNIETSNALDFISRFCSKLNIDKLTQDICRSFIDKIEKLGIASDNTPPSLAASVIYFACVYLNIKIEKKTLSKHCEISQITLNKCYKKLDNYKSHFIDEKEIEQIKSKYYELE